MSTGHPIQINAVIFQKGMCYERDYDPNPKDAVIYALVISDLSSREKDIEKYFVTMDRDLRFPGVQIELWIYNCKILFMFKDALDFDSNRVVAQVPSDETH